MGTRSLVSFYNAKHDETPAFVMYRQFDGYPRVAGADLFDFLKSSNPALDAGELGAKFFRKHEEGGDRVADWTDKSSQLQEWNYSVFRDGGKFHITVSNYNDRVFSGSMEGFRDLINANGGAVTLPEVKDILNADVNGEWMSTSPDTQSIDVERRENWCDDLRKQIAEDPTVSFIGSGDRLMVAMIDDISDDNVVHATIEDCIVTRRRFLKIKCKPQVEDKSTVSKAKVGSALADVENHMKKFDVINPTDLKKWRDEMWEWLNELDQLTY